MKTFPGNLRTSCFFSLIPVSWHIDGQMSHSSEQFVLEAIVKLKWKGQVKSVPVWLQYQEHIVQGKTTTTTKNNC